MKSGGGVFFVKKVDLTSTQDALRTVSVFFIIHFTYLGGAHPTHPPLPTGLSPIVVIAFVQLCKALNCRIL